MNYDCDPNWEVYVPEIRDALLNGKLTTFAGAGVSMDGRAKLPGWTDLVTCLLRAIAGPDDIAAYEFVANRASGYMALLFNEVMLQQMRNVLGLDATADALNRCLDAAVYNPAHRFLAWTLNQLRCPVLTTNLDELIERAANPQLPSDQFLKLHGTIRNPEKARFTVDNVFQPLESRLHRRTIDLVAGQTLLVIGYRGEDEYDVVPALISGSRKPARVLWIVNDRRRTPKDRVTQPPPKLTEGICQRLRTRFARKTAVAIAANPTELLRHVYTAVVAIRPEFADTNLTDWDNGPTALPERWWEGRIAEWGAELRQTRVADLRYLWSRILDHLKVFDNVRGTNFVENAYRRLTEAEGVPPHRLLEMELRLIAMRRTLGETDVQERFVDVTARLSARITDALQSGTAADVRVWQRLRGQALHQHGVALQNARKFDEALAKINEAQAYREEIDDPEQIFSLFQRFMLATIACGKSKSDGRELDELAPKGWRLPPADKWSAAAKEFMSGANIEVPLSNLAAQLISAAKQLEANNNPTHAGTIWHNAGYVHQVLAEEAEETAVAKDRQAREAEALAAEAKTAVPAEFLNLRAEAVHQRQVAETTFGRALRCYQRGKAIRTRLRDPRMIAQSGVRVAQCEIGLVRLELHQGLQARAAREKCLKKLTQAAADWSEVATIYKGLPQEENRKDALDRLSDDILRLFAKFR